MATAVLVSAVPIAVPAMAPGAGAATKNAKNCSFVVGKTTHFSGSCKVEDLGGGTYIISDPKLVIGCDINGDNKPDKTDDCAGAEERVFRKGAFVYVTVFDKNTADLSWNELTSTSAQAPLGEVKRSGNCWNGNKVKICWKV